MEVQPISLVLLLIIVTAVPCSSYRPAPAVIETTPLTATEGSCVEIKCEVKGYVSDEDALWIWMKNGTWDNSLREYTGTVVYSNKITERPISPQFEGRVTYTGSSRLHRAGSSNNPSCSVLICDLRRQDSGKYFFRYFPKEPTEKWKTSDVHLTVRENPCPVTFNKPEPVQDSSYITLSCSTESSCYSYLVIKSVPPSRLETTTTAWWSQPATLSFRASWEDDGREFICQTQGNTDKYLVKKTTITVLYAPRDTKAVISSSDVTEGHSVTLTCSAKGQPTPTFTWNKNQARSSSDTPTGAIWKINPVQVEHSGEYFCMAHNKHGTQRSNIVQIDVQYAPSVEVRVSSQPPYRRGQIVTLICNVIQSNPPPKTFTWYKDEQRLTWGQTHDKSLQSEDSGSYKCSAVNTVATTQSSPLQIDVQYKPKNTNIEIVSQSSTVTVNGSVVFKCNTKANPAAHEYHWYQDSNYHQTTAEHSLELRRVQRTDGGCYSCSAKNRIGSGDHSRVRCIEVQYPPTKLTLSMETEVTEGQRVSITCRVESSPNSTLTLRRTSEGSTKELQKETDLNSLSYTVTVSSAHSGEYTCSAHNSLGSESKRSSLTVKYRPQKVTVQADPGLVIKENETLTLHCSAQSHPPVTSVTWTRGHRSVHTGPTFSVESVSVSDSGLYSCTAHNEIGQGASAPAEVKVKFGPKHTEVVRAEEVQSPDGSRSVTLSCSSHSFPPVSLYTWYRRMEGRDLEVSKHSIYIVKSTHPGVYYCTAKNEISETRSEPVSLFQDGGHVKFIIVTALFLLIILLVALFIYRRRKKSVQEGSSNTSRVQGGNSRSRDDPGPQQRADITNGTSAINAVYSTVNLPKDKPGRAATREQQECSLNYASIHFEKKNKNMPVKTIEDVVYSTVKRPDQDTADVYENITAVQKPIYPNLDLSYSDSSEDEVDVTYTQVNFSTKGQSRDGPSLSEEEETQYSDLNL